MLRREAALFALTMPLLLAVSGGAQVPPPVPVPRPQFNPSTPLVIPRRRRSRCRRDIGNGIGSGAGSVDCEFIDRAFPDSSYSIIAPKTAETPPIKHRNKHHPAVHHPALIIRSEFATPKARCRTQ